MSLEFRFQSASTDYQKIQTELASFVDSRTRLDAQLSENEMVKKVRQRLIRIRSASPVLISSRSLHNWPLITLSINLWDPYWCPKNKMKPKLMWRHVWNLSRAKCQCFHVWVECEAYQHHRKRVDAQIKDGEDRSEKKKNEVWDLPTFTSDEFDCRVAACRNPIQTSAGSTCAESLDERFFSEMVDLLPEVIRSGKPTARLAP